MLIQATYLWSLFSMVLMCGIVTAGRRKGALNQLKEFKHWKGTTVKSATASVTNENSSVQNWTGRWFPSKPASPPKSNVHLATPFKYPENTPKISDSNFVPSNVDLVCDDGQHYIDIDFDPNDIRQSYNYLCLHSNHSEFEPNLNTEAILIEHFIPPAFTPPIKCINESIAYGDPIPTYGSFRPLAPKYGTYQYLPPQRWLHSLAKGAIVMLYHPCAFPGQVTVLKNTLKSCMYHHIITPSQILSPKHPLALLAWGKSLQMSVVDERIVVSFIKLNAKNGPLTPNVSIDDFYKADLLEEAKLITNTEDAEICGYAEM